MATASQKLRPPSSWAKHKRNFDENDNRRERRAAKRLAVRQRARFSAARASADDEYPDNTRDCFDRDF